MFIIPKKKTQEEYVDELAMKNPDIEVMEKYIDARTPILHYCNKHNVFWKISPSNALKGKGCSGCLSEKLHNRFTKTHEQYVNDVKKVNPDITVLERYIDSSTPILHYCQRHDITWKPFPSNILKGYGCVECGKEKFKEKRLKSNEQYILELKNKHSHLKVIDEYIDSRTPITHLCTIHNVYWKISPSNALKGNGFCTECKNDYMRSILGMSHSQYVNKVSTINPNIEVIGRYINENTKILHHCLIHDIYWNITPYSILRGCGCFKCRIEKIKQSNTLSNDEYVAYLKELNQTVINIELYINMKTPILHKCLIHDVLWKTSPSSVLQGAGCSKCCSEKLSLKLSKTHNEYVNELQNINPDIIAIEEYSGANTPILHKCLIDGNEWYTAPTCTLSGYGCPICRESKGERKIHTWLDKHNIPFIFQKKFQDCKNIRALPFDFYLPEYNLAIEYDGKQHYEPIEFFGGEKDFKKTQYNDNIKNEYCKNNGIKLLRIPYFKNVEEELEQFLFI